MHVASQTAQVVVDKSDKSPRNERRQPYQSPHTARLERPRAHDTRHAGTRTTKPGDQETRRPGGPGKPEPAH
jgi:hypothetical protein